MKKTITNGEILEVSDSYPNNGKNVTCIATDKKTGASFKRIIPKEEYELENFIALLKEKYKIKSSDVSILEKFIDDFGSRKYSEGTDYDFD